MLLHERYLYVWGEVIMENREPDFDPEEYLKDYSKMLSAESIRSCQTKEDCEELLVRLNVMIRG